MLYKNKKKKRRANWVGHILSRNCLIKHVEGKIGGRIEVTGRQRRCSQLLDDLKET